MFIKYRVFDHETKDSTQSEIGEFAGISFDRDKAWISFHADFHDIVLPMTQSEYNSFLNEIYNAISSDKKIVTINNVVVEDTFDDEDEYYEQDIADECYTILTGVPGSYHLM